MSNEFLLFIDVQIGFLHSGTEKLLEFKSVSQSVAYFDSLDYVSVVHNEHVFVFAYEVLCMSSIGFSVSLVRVLMLEITRLFNGLLANSCAVFDLGSLSPLLWAFEESEKIMIVFDWVSGVSMHMSFVCVGGVLDDLSFMLLDYLGSVTVSSMMLLDLLDVTVVGSRLCYLSLRGLCLVDLSDVSYFSLSGVMISCVGMAWDVSVIFGYELYGVLSVDVCVSYVGDSYDSLWLFLIEFRVLECICRLFVLEVC